MPDRSPPARDRHRLTRTRHTAQALTCAASSLIIVLFVLSPDFARAAVMAARALIATILN